MNRQFLERARKAISNPILQQALDNNAINRHRGRALGFAQLQDPAEAQQRARSIRVETIQKLDEVIGTFRRNLEKNGIQVHIADDTESAQNLILEILRVHNAKHVVKSKSMVTEEIHLNAALEASNIETVETDLGEYIIQLRDETPAHIITPAIHLLREQVADTFEQELGMPYTTDIFIMVATARESLRRCFLRADAGISGVNFGIAETGSLCLVTNEGNGRMVSTLPGLHIAVMGKERVLPKLKDLGAMLNLLPRSATGQKLTSYVTLINHPRQTNDLDGPVERHVVIVDNGRSKMREGDFHEALLCIRCGACLDVCPIYREIGGHAYDSVYAGPIGSVISPQLFGTQMYGHLGKASTLCGACAEACPVNIDLPTLLLRVRKDYVRSVKQPRLYKIIMRLYSFIAISPLRYRLALSGASWISRLVLRKNNWFRWLPGLLGTWTKSRDFPPFAPVSFRRNWKNRQDSTLDDVKVSNFRAERNHDNSDENEPRNLMECFVTALEAVDGEFVACSEFDIGAKMLGKLNEMNTTHLITNPKLVEEQSALIGYLKSAGVEILMASSTDGSSQERFEPFDDSPVGLTGSSAAFADTGTVVLSQEQGRAGATSLLPETHFVVLDSHDLHDAMDTWLDQIDVQEFTASQSHVFITGPSRTADIEMTLTIGVHGPRKVVVFGLR